MWLAFVFLADLCFLASHQLASAGVKRADPNLAILMAGLHNLVFPLLFFFVSGVMDASWIGMGDGLLIAFLGVLGVWMLFPLYKAYQTDHPEVVVPIIQSSAIAVLLFCALPPLSEGLTPFKGIGFGLILGGGVLASFVKKGSNFSLGVAFRWGITFAVALGLFYALTKFLVRGRPAEQTLAVYLLHFPGGFLGMLTFFLIPGFRKSVSRFSSLPRKTKLILFLVEFTGAVGFFPMLFALQLFPAAGVVKAAQGSLLQLLIIGWGFAFRRNSTSFRRLGLAAALVIAGLWLANL